MDFDRNDTGGGALAIGFLLLILVLYRSPQSAIEAATGDGQSALFFLVLPVVGLLAGAYDLVDGPYSVVGVFLLASYLGVFGLGVSLRYLVTATPADVFLGIALLLVVLAVVALVSSVLRLIPSVGLVSSIRTD
jgi:hypothetical protein